MIKYLLCLTCAIQVYLIHPLYAENLKDPVGKNIFLLSLEELMEIEVTTASKVEEKAFESASAIFVITNEDIKRSGATSIPEALRMAPGIQVAQIDSSKWAITSRGFNRQYSNKLLVLFDGRSVYTPLFSGVYWDSQDYVLEDIDRIEVVRGPGGTLWGENAVNGVINIITKKAVDTQGQYLSALAGNFDRFNTEYRYGGKTEEGAYYRVYGKYLERDETNDLYGDGMNNQWRSAKSGFKFEKAIDEQTSYTIQGDVYEGNEDQILYLPTASGTSLTEGDELTQGGNVIAKYSKKFASDNNLDVQFYIDHEDRNLIIVDQRRTTLDLDVQYAFQATDKDNTIIGFEIRDIHDKLDSSDVDGTTYIQYDPTKLSYQIYSFFIQNKHEIIPDKLFITLGSKFGYNDFTDFNVQPTIRASYLPSVNHHFWSAISRAVRSPTRAEDGIELLAGYVGSTALYQIGQQDYDNEYLTAYELGYRFKDDGFSVDLTAFFNDYDDLRTMEYDGVDQYLLTNLGDGKVYGFEAVSSFDIQNNWRVSLTYTFLKTDIKNAEGYSYSGDNLSNEGISPEHQFAIKSYYNFTNKLTMSNMLYYYDELTATGKEVDDYIKFDTKISYMVSDNLDIDVVGQNLLDPYHQEFSKGLYSTAAEIGTNYYLRFNYKF